MIQPADGSPPKVTSTAEAPLDAHAPAPADEAGAAAPMVKSFEDVKAEMMAKAAEAAAAAKPPEEPKPADGDEVDGITTEELAAFVTRSKAIRAEKAKVRALEADAPNVAKAKAIAEAIAAGNHFEAAKLAGIDMTKATMQAMGEEGVDPKDAEIAALKAKEKAREDAEAATAAKAAQDAAIQAGREATVAEVVKDAATFPALSKDPPAIRKALIAAEELFVEVQQDKKRALTRAEADRLIRACLDTAEAEAKAKNPSSHSATPSRPSQRQTASRVPRAPLTSPSKPLSFDEARALIRRK